MKGPRTLVKSWQTLEYNESGLRQQNPNHQVFILNLEQQKVTVLDYEWKYPEKWQLPVKLTILLTYVLG